MIQEATVTMKDGRRLPATLWTDGEKSRRARVTFTEDNEQHKGVAYLTASDPDGRGISIWLRTLDDVVLANEVLADVQEAALSGWTDLPLFAGPATFHYLPARTS